jgi:hypothetical protein
MMWLRRARQRYPLGVVARIWNEHEMVNKWIIFWEDVEEMKGEMRTAYE